MENPKLISGGILEGDQKFYIERACDYEVVKNLKDGNYIALIGPRQQGKTSLVHALQRRKELSEWVFIYVDVSTLNKKTAADWYTSLCGQVDKQLAGASLPIGSNIPRVNSTEWRNYLSELASAAHQAGRRVIIALDEIATAKFDGSNEFFGVARAVYSARAAEPHFCNLSFLLVGTFSTQDLISDPLVSPFNISYRPKLEDFTVEEVTRLAGQYGWDAAIGHALARSIIDWTSGQPYLCQTLLSILSSDRYRDEITEADAAVVVEKAKDVMLATDFNHMRAIRDRLNRLLASQDFDYRAELDNILRGQGSTFYPHLIVWQEHLDLLGLIKRDSNGRCCIRSRIYEDALKIVLQSSEPFHRESKENFGVLELFEQRIHGSKTASTHQMTCVPSLRRAPK